MNIKRLGINKGGLPVAGYNGDGSECEHIASLLGAKFPAVYLDFLRIADGGHPEICIFRPPNSSENNIFSINNFYSLKNPSLESIEEALINWQPLLGKGMLPIARDGGDNQIVLEVKPGSESVWLILHDEDMAKIKIADSFEDFIDNLTPETDFI